MPITDSPPEVASSVHTERMAAIQRIRRENIASAIATDPRAFSAWLRHRLPGLKPSGYKVPA